MLWAAEYPRSHTLSAHVAKNARELLLKEYRGALSTLSKAMPGFPFGSVVPYCLDEQGRPLILISRIAQHTHNLQLDPKCSLLVGERDAEDVQATGRVTLMAEATKLVDPVAIEAAAQRYYRYFPESESYHSAHNFDFWVLAPVRYRFIGGFGAIHWLDDVALANPFAGASETSMVEHMNEDHTKAIAHYVELSPRLNLHNWSALTAKACTCASVWACTGWPLHSLATPRHKCAKPWFSWLTQTNGQ